MAEEIKQIKVGDTTYNIEPYTSYITLSTQQDNISGRKTFTGGVKISGRYQNSGDDEGLIIGRAANNYAGLCLGDPGGVRSVFYLNPSNSALWRYYNGSATYDITHPGKAGTIALTSDLNYKNVGALPDYTVTINHQSAGNPHIIKFVSVNYSSVATCFKMSATTCHDNGASYKHLTDILISVTTAGEVYCDIFKFAQQSVGSVDGVARCTGDVFYVNNTSTKVVDFYILCGQWSSSQFTPITIIGSTSIAGVTQYSGNEIGYSGGTKAWASGCGRLMLGYTMDYSNGTLNITSSK